jgi:hypothetical protein
MYRVLFRLSAVIGVAGMFVVLSGGAAFAVPAPPPAVNDLATVINNLRFWVIGFLATLATLFLVIGGARYLVSGGDPSEVERAKEALKSAAVGYGLALLAPVFLSILNSILRP